MMYEAIGYLILLLCFGIALFVWILVMVVVSRAGSDRLFPQGLGDWQEGVKFVPPPRDWTLFLYDDETGFNPRITSDDVRTAFRWTLIALALFTIWSIVDRYLIR